MTRSDKPCSKLQSRNFCLYARSIDHILPFPKSSFADFLFISNNNYSNLQLGRKRLWKMQKQENGISNSRVYNLFRKKKCSQIIGFLVNKFFWWAVTRVLGRQKRAKCNIFFPTLQYLPWFLHSSDCVSVSPITLRKRRTLREHISVLKKKKFTLF